VEKIGEKGGYGYVKYINPKISSVNDFFAVVFPNFVFFPFLVWTYVFSPLS
jgi:hypothetical protein